MKIENNNLFLMKQFNIIFVLIFFFFSTVAVYAQKDQPKFTVKLKFSTDDGDMKHAAITITKNGAPYKVLDPNGGAKFNVDLELGAEFLFTYTKMGYITKSVVVDTHIPEGREKEEFAKFTADVEIIKQPEGQLITYTQPVGRIKYSMNAGDFDFDKDYSANAEEMQRKAEASPIPAPKPPEPNAKPVTAKPPPPVPLPPSKPIAVEVKEPEYTPPPSKPKEKEEEAVVNLKTTVVSKEMKIIQKDRLKITIVTVNIDGTDFIYRKEEYAWGGVYYYRDDINISIGTFELETE